jgi:hypothetical protein
MRLTCQDPCGSLFLHPLAAASLLQYEVKMTQIGWPDPPHIIALSRMSCLLMLTGTSVLLSFFFFLADQVLSAPLPTPHSFACCLTPYAYNFDHLNVHRLQPPPAHHSATMPPSTAAVLLAVVLLGASLSARLLRCLLTSPHVSHCNGMQHLCALAQCMCQVHQGNMWVFLDARPWSQSQHSSHFGCVVTFLSLFLCHWLYFLFFSLSHWHQRYIMDWGQSSNSFCTYKPVIIKLACNFLFFFSVFVSIGLLFSVYFLIFNF